MKNVLFISSFNSNVLESDGVAKKIKLEMETFRAQGFVVDFLDMSNEGVYLCSKNNKIEKLTDWKGTYHKTYVEVYKSLKKEDTLKYDILYIRYEHISFSMLLFLRFFKKNNEKNRIVIAELPTVVNSPYKNSPWKVKLAFWIKKYMNMYLPKNIDYMVTFSEHNRIWGIEAINIENFIDLDSLPIKKETKNDVLHLLGVANISPAHGYDRIIKGLFEYYKNKGEGEIIFHIVGNGAKESGLIQLTQDLGLDKNIIFHGPLGGKQLDDIFDKCDIGIGALAVFRKGSDKVSELKIREYTARCMPFIYTAKEPVLLGQKFCLKMTNTEEPIDMSLILKFWNEIKYDKELKLLMRNFAIKEFTAIRQLNKIFEKLNQI